MQLNTLHLNARKDNALPLSAKCANFYKYSLEKNKAMARSQILYSERSHKKKYFDHKVIERYKRYKK